MSFTKSGNQGHDDACNTAEATRQSAGVAGVSQVTISAAEIVFYRACLASANVRGLNTAPYRRALQDLGTGGV